MDIVEESTFLSKTNFLLQSKAEVDYGFGYNPEFLLMSFYIKLFNILINFCFYHSVKLK
jgi:hypothetical protein